MVNFVRRDQLRLQNFIMSGSQFLTQVRSFIANSVREGKLSQDKGKAYFKEILHTVLFQGRINLPVIQPEEFFKREEFEQLSAKYPDVFQKYSTHLPKRPPYTVLLDAVVEITRTRHVDDVLKCLVGLTEQTFVEFIGRKKCENEENSKCGNVFVSTVISYCYFWDVNVRKQITDNYFGASVSCNGRKQRQIMIDILCCETWHKDISWAVCIGNMYNTHAFMFRPEVHSTAFMTKPPAPDSKHDPTPVDQSDVQISLSLEVSRNLRAPCERCFTMFPEIIFHPNHEPNDQARWEYGNCAECESLSQFMYTNPQIDKRLQFIMSPTALIDLKRQRLNNNLRSLEFNVEHEFLFYDPSV
uniref:uncharacterized protein n=1 Tax=Pristiophorus japonicus TaxID=55135 RepID=UPI00398F2EAF